MGECILFIITGIFVGKGLRESISEKTEVGLMDFWRLTAFYVLMIVARFFVILVFFPFYNNKNNKYETKLTVKECVIIALGGIRGAFPLIIYLTVMQNPNYNNRFKSVVQLITVGIILFGMLFNGFLIKFFTKAMGITNDNNISIDIKKPF